MIHIFLLLPQIKNVINLFYLFINSKNFIEYLLWSIKILKYTNSFQSRFKDNFVIIFKAKDKCSWPAYHYLFFCFPSNILNIIIFQVLMIGWWNECDIFFKFIVVLLYQRKWYIICVCSLWCYYLLSEGKWKYHV